MADEKKQGLFGIEVAFSKADDEAERELQPMEQDMNEAGEPAFEGEPEFEEDLEDDSEDSLTYSNGVIEKIVAMATREVPHVLGMKGNLMHLVQISRTILRTLSPIPTALSRRSSPWPRVRSRMCSA